jgi:hypothetical protein
MIPQITMIVLYALNLGIAMALHGKPKTGENNFWVQFIAINISAALLYYGGFWLPLLH